jgi:hypothetical protein
MNEIDSIISQLQLVSSSDWAGPALVALSSPGIKFAGQSMMSAENSAGELIRLYENRLLQRQVSGVNCVGIESLLKSLHAAMPREEGISVKPFLSETHSVTAFYDAGQRLLSRVTLERKQPA